MHSSICARACVAVLALLLLATDFIQAWAQTPVELPPVTVTSQNKPKPAANAAMMSKAKARSQVLAPDSATASAAPDAGATLPSDALETATVGGRAGSLGVPTAAEATAEINRTPGGVDLVTAEDYAKATPALTIKDALDYVPGVFVQPKWGEDSRLSIRGSGLSRNFHGRGIQLLVDGIIPITTADGGGDFQEIDPTVYKYIEVYRGGNALRYGANQLGGAINFVMPTGYDADLFGARLDFGSFGLKKLAVSSGAVSGSADYFVTGTIQESDGFRDHSDGDSQRMGFNVGYRVTPDIETRVYLNANRIRQDIPGAVTRAEALGSPERAFVRPGAPVNFSGTGNDNVDRDYERNIDSIRVANRTTVRLARGTFAEVGGFYFNRHLDHPIFAVIDNDNEEGGGFARLVDDRLIGGFRNRFVAGVNVHNGTVRSRLYRNELGEQGALFSEAKQESENTSVYAENSFFVVPTVALVGGGQFAYAARQSTDLFLSNGVASGEADYDFWNPKGGIVWDVTPFAQVFANISKSGEAPTFNEITITTITTTSLKPQEAITYEIGTRGATPDFRWDLALYRSELENEFQCLAVGNAGTCTQINLDQSIHQGVEAGIGAALLSGVFEHVGQSDKLWLNAAYTFSDFRFDNDAVFGDNQLPGAPRHFVRAELLYKHPSGVYAGPNVEWVPEAYFVDSANTVETEAYALLGAKLGFDDGGRVSAYVEARNLTDEAYIASASIAIRANATSLLFEPGSGRAVYTGVQVRW